MKRVLVITHDKVGKKMAGPGMRYHQIALELVKEFDVSLGAFNPCYITMKDKDVPYSLVSIEVSNYSSVFEKFDVIIALWLSEEMISFAKEKNIQLIFDLYAPVPVEELVAKIYAKNTAKIDGYNYRVLIEGYKAILRAGDLFLCSNIIQKDFWTGFAFASNAIDPYTFHNFPIENRLVTLPMGINLDEINHKINTNKLRERIPKIKKDDFVIAWTGGIWDWFDGVTPVEAISILVKKGIKDIKFVFLATKHPNTDVPEMDETSRSHATAKRDGLLDKYVFYLPGWLDYHERIDYFSSANVALYAHKPSIEARYSHRTRVLDHILCELPTIATSGDYLAKEIEQNKLGSVVPPENPRAMAEAIEKIYKSADTRNEIKKNIQRAQPNYEWSESCKDLVKFLKTDNAVRPIVTEDSNTRHINSVKKRIPTKVRNMVPQPVKKAIKRFVIN